MKDHPSLEYARQMLQKYWGFSDFRPAQAPIIASVLEGKDTLALLPTGGGKSVCFQIPAMCQDGLCLVISPLIALMKDQVQHLVRRGIEAVAIYAGMAYRDIDRLLDNCVMGKVKFLYVSPERLTTDLFVERFRRMKINLIAVDEAHCVSQWGYDFRPPYLEISKIRALQPTAPLIALTATAIPAVLDDLQEKLAFRQKNVFSNSFARENLTYVVLEEEAKNEKLLDILKKIRGSAVVYVRSRKKTKLVADLLQKQGFSADFYHAGLDTTTRSQKQDAWAQGKTHIMVATNAFGMGIDKPDVRVVVHLDLPDSLEAYFQEAGRAGRDGKPAYAVLLYHAGDLEALEHAFEQAFPDLKTVRRVYQALGSHFQLAVGSGKGESFDFDVVEFARTYQMTTIEVFNCLKILMREGWIVLTESVFVPPSLQVLVRREELYDFQLKNKGFERLLTAILRVYQGAFQLPVPIQEFQLAHLLKIDVERLRRGLGLLEQQGIVRYFPSKDAPQVIFLHERLDAANLTIDQNLYHFLKERQRNRLQAMSRYVAELKCRSQQLLSYFGETNAPPCGKCDVCTHRHSDEMTTAAFENYQKKLEKLLRQRFWFPKDLLLQFPDHQRKKVEKVLRFLLEQGFVIEKNGKISWRN